jgi:hypothetical protein
MDETCVKGSNWRDVIQFGISTNYMATPRF